MRRTPLLVCLTVTLAAAHEVPTHKEITKQALSYLIDSLADRADEQKKFQLCQQRILDILIGSEQSPGGVPWEDDAYGNRFMFHFNPVLHDTVHGLFVAANCTSEQWGFESFPSGLGGAELSPLCQHNQPFMPGPVLIDAKEDADAIVQLESLAVDLQNKHTWQSAIASGLNGAVEDGWRHLGFILHLAQDLTSPAHVRSDAHPHLGDGLLQQLAGDPDPLELAEYKNPTLLPERPIGLPEALNHPEKSAQQMFEELQVWTQSNFYSKDTLFAATTAANDPLQGPPCSGITDDQFVIDPAGRHIAYFDMSALDYITKRQLADMNGLSACDFAQLDASIDYNVMPGEQWKELGPQAVNYTASLIYRYFKDIGGKVPCSGCYDFSGVFTSDPVLGNAPWMAKGTAFNGRITFDASKSRNVIDQPFPGSNNPTSRYFFPADSGGGIDVTIGPYGFTSVWQGDMDPRPASEDTLLLAWLGTMPKTDPSMAGTDYVASDGAAQKQPTPPLSSGNRLAVVVTLNAAADLFQQYYLSPYPPGFSPGASPPAFGVGNFTAGVPPVVNNSGRIDTFGICQSSPQQ